MPNGVDGAGEEITITSAVAEGCDETYAQNINHCWALKRKEIAEYFRINFFAGARTTQSKTGRRCHYVVVVYIHLAKKNSLPKFIKYALKSESKRKIIWRFFEPMCVSW